MFIDVWDGDSLHLIGTATLQLKELLRHGKEAVQTTFELDIISTEYDDDTRLNTGNTVIYYIKSKPKHTINCVNLKLYCTFK